MQAKVNRELASLEADLTSTDVSKGYVIHSKSKINSASQGMEENNVLLSQTMTSDNGKEALAHAATALSLFSPSTDNLAMENLSQGSIKMKCYYLHTHCCFLDYFNDSIPDDAVIYASDIPFQYNKIEGRHTKFIGNPIGRVFIVAKRDHKFLLGQRSNKIYISSNSINFGLLNTNEKCISFIHLASAYTGNLSQYIYGQG